MITHYWIDDYGLTACGIIDGENYKIQMSYHKNKVTCKRCLKTRIFKRKWLRWATEQVVKNRIVSIMIDIHAIATQISNAHYLIEQFQKENPEFCERNKEYFKPLTKYVNSGVCQCQLLEGCKWLGI